MLLSTIQKIIAQLPTICANLNLDQKEMDRAFFLRGEEAGNVLVDVGEIHMGGTFRLIFDVCGNLKSVLLGTWHPSDPGPRFRQAKVNIETLVVS